MKTDRLLAIVTLLLAKRKCTAKELAERFEVSVRTVYRDIEALSIAGIPVYTERGPGGGISLESDYTLDRTLLTAREQKDLLTALTTMQAAQYPGMEGLREKLEALFRPAAPDWIKVLFSGWENDREQVFYTLRDAILESHPVWIEYANAQGEISSRTVEPIQLIARGQGWYVSAWCRSKEDYRFFRLSRIRRAEPLEERCARREPPPQPISDGPKAIIHLRLRFHPAVEYRVLDEYPLQDIRRLEDGYMEVLWAYPDNAWVLSHLLSFGGFVEVLSPERMRIALAEQAKEIARLYNADTQVSS